MADKPRAMNRLMVAEPYDMDTMIGTNNSGVLMFSPYLEDTDTVSAVISGEGGSDAPVFNAQDSVLWQNLRDAFRDQITTMYRNLRAGNKWNAKYIANYFDEMQSKWPEAMFNEDGRTKYLIPLIDPVTVDEDTGELIRTDRYLTMLQGSKAEQRKWWLYNRFRYMDSKYNTGDASKTINLRLFNGGTLTLTPAIDLYVGVSFGGGTTPALKRTTAETPQTFEYVAPSGVTEMETWIYSADLITDVGDLSVFYPNELDFSRAARLRRLKVGSDATGYANNNLTTINVSNNPLLEYIDCRNCPRLAESIEIEKSTRLKEAYFEGSGITGIELADGCTIEHLHLPASITALTLMNLDKLTDLQLEGVSNVTRLMLSSMDPDVIDALEVVGQMPANSQIYIEGLDLELADAAAIDEFLDFLDTMKGVTRTRGTNGDWIYHEEEKAQVSGKIHTDSLTGDQIEEFNNRYPYIEVTADHTEATLYYHNWEADSAVIAYETVIDGGNGTNAPSSVSHASTLQYNYTFIGWSKVPLSTTVDPDALKEVSSNRHVYAVYRKTVRTYTVTFSNPDNSSDNAYVYNVPYGGSTTYPKSTTPSVPGIEEMTFTGWLPEPRNITGNTTCIAQFKDTRSKVLQLVEGILRVADDEEGNRITTIYDEAFSYNSKLTSVNFPAVVTVGSRAFANCTTLVNVNLPAAISFGNGAFTGVSQLQEISLPSATTFGQSIFYNCYNLLRIMVPVVTSIDYAFAYNCSKLTAILISTPSVCTAKNSMIIASCPNVIVYVPDNLVDAYKEATNWSNYANKIRGLSEVPST